MKNIPWSIPSLDNKERKAILNVFDSKWLSQGPKTKELEKKISKEIGGKYVIMTNNGTSSLICSLLSHGIGPGDEVIVPSLTFVATVNSILAVGAKPILVDNNPNTFNTEIKFIKKKLTKKTKAILPVDISGISIDIDEFRDFTLKNNLILIEDAAEAIGGEYKNRKIGSFGHTTIFSFHMAKVITGIEGGCIITNNKKISDSAKLIRSHGEVDKYNSKIFGLNFRISDIHSTIILEQLKKIKKFLIHRNRLAKIYQQELSDFNFQEIPDFVTMHPYMLFAILISPKKRDKVNYFLNKHGIDTRICWPPIHRQTFHSKLFKKEKFIGADSVYSQIINLPMGNGLSEEQITYVSKMIKKAIKQF